jgi:hypothetical protein
MKELLDSVLPKKEQEAFEDVAGLEINRENQKIENRESAYMMKIIIEGRDNEEDDIQDFHDNDLLPKILG